MNYRENNLQPEIIYEAFKLLMKRGDAISLYIVERMKKEEVIGLIKEVQVPTNVVDALRDCRRYSESAAFWLLTARFISAIILPLVVFSFFIVLFLSVWYFLTMSVNTGLKTLFFCGAVFSFYMICYSMVQIFFHIAMRRTVKVTTIIANIECYSEINK
jgi:hypothetical protein